MKIYHGPNNIAGAAGVLARAQRELGFQAESACFDTGSYRYQADRTLKRGVTYRAKDVLFDGSRFDVFHFYFGQSLIGPTLLDVRALRALGKKVYFYFCGCDIRHAKRVIERYEFSACKECWPVACSANRRHALEVALRSDGIFVSTPDLLEFVPGAELLPQPIDLQEFSAMAAQLVREETVARNRVVRVAHAPSSRALKGTVHIERAVAELREEGVPIELVLIEGKSHAEAMQICLDADIAIDQLLIGAYGQFAVEMMALGKPVVCYIREDLRPLYPSNLPVVSADPRSIKRVLRELAEAPEQWSGIGQAGKEYVEAQHCARVVAQKALKKYGA